jgi:hypothetical protein
MKKLTIVVFAAAGLVAGCGGTSPITFCNDFETEVCARVFECYDATTKASAAFMTAYGSSQTECAAKLKASNCATVTNDKPCADSTQKFHSDKADACEADLRAASCATITGGGFSSANCDAVCS